MEKLKDIIRNNNMSTRPEFYSGRGATTSDLNSDILFGIHKDIKKEYGEDAAKNFVKMVADLKIASATAFLQRLYDLSNNDWKYFDRESQSAAEGVAIEKNADGEYDSIHGMVSMMNAMHSGINNQTNRIVGSFLSANGCVNEKTWHTDADSYRRYYK
jgi:hypothetical protein